MDFCSLVTMIFDPGNSQISSLVYHLFHGLIFLLQTNSRYFIPLFVTSVINSDLFPIYWKIDFFILGSTYPLRVSFLVEEYFVSLIFCSYSNTSLSCRVLQGRPLFICFFFWSLLRKYIFFSSILLLSSYLKSTQWRSDESLMRPKPEEVSVWKQWSISRSQLVYFLCIDC